MGSYLCFNSIFIAFGGDLNFCDFFVSVLVTAPRMTVFNPTN